MFFLTSYERKVLLFIGILILSGSTLKLFNVNSKKISQVKVAPQISLININTASLKELESVKGIGPVTASLIIRYRSQFGSFNDLDDLKKVKGIGEKKIENMKDQIIFR